MNVCAIIAAAGRSQRFNGQDKLLADLGGRTVLVRTVEAFARRDEVRSIIVAVAPDRLDELRDRIGPTLAFHGARLVAGGTTERWESVRNALTDVPEDATHVAVHDGARPAVTDALLDRVFEAAGRLDAVVPAMNVTDTLKRVVADAVDASEDEDPIADLILGSAGKQAVAARAVVGTVDRANLVAVQTPQVFTADLLRRAYAQDALDGSTDDASLVERLGEAVHVVDGDPRNIKITRPDDLDLIRSIMHIRPEAERPAHKRF